MHVQRHYQMPTRIPQPVRRDLPMGPGRMRCRASDQRSARGAAQLPDHERPGRVGPERSVGVVVRPPCSCAPGTGASRRERRTRAPERALGSRASFDSGGMCCLGGSLLGCAYESASSHLRRTAHLANIQFALRTGSAAGGGPQFDVRAGFAAELRDLRLLVMSPVRGVRSVRGRVAFGVAARNFSPVKRRLELRPSLVLVPRPEMLSVA